MYVTSWTRQPQPRELPSGPGLLATRAGQGGHREEVGAERRGGKVLLVPEVAQRIVRPAVPDRDGVLDPIAADDDRIALDLGLGIDELAVRAGDRETLERAVLLEPLHRRGILGQGLPIAPKMSFSDGSDSRPSRLVQASAGVPPTDELIRPTGTSSACRRSRPKK